MAEGEIDAMGNRLVDLDQANPLTSALINNQPRGAIFDLLDTQLVSSGPFQIHMEVARQIEVPGALHQISSEFATELGKFFDQHIPEPTSVLLTLLGAAALGWRPSRTRR